MRIKKFLTILLTIAMVVSLLPATAFAANNTATTMRLAKTQGTVVVTNATGKKVTQTANMKLYNGYKMKTGAKSYAWISLDDTKVAKLDANSSVEVQKSGKALTLFVSSGNLFFNVKNPLKSGETFSIKTSTMTTGIRGTSGCVRVISDRVTEVHLLTGQVQIYTEHPVLDVHKTATLQAGQKATSLIDWEAMAVSGEMAEIVIEKLENHEVCGICSKEIEEDPALLERIEEEAPHLLPERAADEADERLAADEAEAEAKQEEIDQAVEEQVFPEDVDPYFEEEAGGGGGGSTPVEEVVETGVNSWSALVEAINDFNEGNNDAVIELTGNVPSAREMEEGTNSLADLPEITNNTNDLTLNLQNYTLALNETPLTNSGNLTITNLDGVIANLQDDTRGTNPTIINERGATLVLDDGAIVATGSNNVAVDNNGTFIMNGGEILSGQIDYNVQNGVFTVANADNGGIAVENTGTFTMSGGVIHVAETGVDNNGIFRMSGGTIESLQYNDANGNPGVASNVVCVDNSALGTFEMTGGSLMPVINSAMFGSYTKAVTNAGGEVSLQGGEIMLMSVDGLVAGGNAGNVYEGTGGDLTIGGNVVIKNTVKLSNTNAVMSGGTISVRQGGTGIDQLSGTLKMTGGTIEVNETDATGISSAGDFEMQGGNVVIGSAATNTVGVRINSTFRMEKNAAIEANAGIGLELNSTDKVTLGEGASIKAYEAAKAVVLTTRDSILLTRPVAADITWQFTTGYTNPGDAEIAAHLFDLPPAGGVTIDRENETATSGTYTYVDTFGQVTDAQAFADAIHAFNTGNIDMSITLNSSFSTAGVQIEPIGTDGGSKTLVIDLGGNTLTLTQSLVNNENLTIMGNGTLDTVPGDETIVSPVIVNNGNVKWESGTLKVPAGGVGIYSEVNASGTVDVSGGVIDATASGAVGIVSAEASGTPITIRGNAVFNVGSCSEEIQENGQYAPDKYAAAVQANYADVTMTGGTIHVNSGTGIYGNGGITFSDGVINVKAGGIGINSESGAVYMDGGEINVEDHTLRYDGNTRGIQFADDTGTLSMSGGEINVNSTLIKDELSEDESQPEAVYGGQTVLLNGGSITATGEFAVTVNSGGVAGDGSGIRTTIKATTEEGLMIGTTFSNLYYADQVGDYYVLKNAAGGGGNSGGDPEVTPPAEPEEPEELVYPEEEGTITTVAELIAAFNSAGTDSVIKLGRDLSMYDVDEELNEIDLVVAAGANITLDLNEYGLELQDPVENRGTLTIIGGNNEQLTWDSTASIRSVAEQEILIENYGTLTMSDTELHVRPGQIGIYNYEGATVNVASGTITVEYDLAEGTGYGIVYVNEEDVTAADSLFSGEGIYKRDQATLLNELALMNANVEETTEPSAEEEPTEPSAENNENTEESVTDPAEDSGETV